jgi:hypothetical protein
MNCREFTEEFEERRSALSQPAQLHLNDCPGCKTTSGKQTLVWRMIDGLKRVDAPNDFDFRVKAKIAGAKPADFQPRFLPVLRYVLPLSLIVLVFGLLAFNTSLFLDNNGASQIVGTVPQTPQTEAAPVNSFSTNQVITTSAKNEPLIAEVANTNLERSVKNQEKQVTIFKSPIKSPTNASKKNFDDNGGGSRVLSVKPPSPVKLPLGFNPNQTVETSPNADNSNFVSDEQILQLLGIEVVRENGNLKVKTVRENSTAKRSDLKAGDVIEAIDGVKLPAEPLRGKRIEVKNLTVVRGATKIEITLKN